MKSSISRLVRVLYVLANLTKHVADSTVEIQCPVESYLNETTSLTCSTSQAYSNIIYKAPTGNSPQCSQTGCTPVSGFQADIINSSCTQLTILSVQQRHAGQWGCADGDNNFEYSKLVVAEKKTTCLITVDSSPVLHEKISLTVTIQNYYCSTASNVSLRVGCVSETLHTALHVPQSISIASTKEINMTKAHFGNVQLELICQKSRTISCEGVTSFHGQNATCSITVDTCPVLLHGKISLTVTIQNYYCSVASNVSLLVGSIRETLSTALHVTCPTNITSTKEINMTKAHFGNVQLELICKGKETIFCEGITSFPGLPDTPPTPPKCPLPQDNREQIAIAVVGTFFVTSFLCILLGVIVFKREELRDFIGRIHPAMAKMLGPTPGAPEQTEQGHSQVNPEVKV